MTLPPIAYLVEQASRAPTGRALAVLLCAFGEHAPDGQLVRGFGIRTRCARCKARISLRARR